MGEGKILPALPATSYSKIQESNMQCKKTYQHNVWVIRQAHEDKSASKKSRCLMKEAKNVWEVSGK